jgi:hypothetical protein
MKNQFVADRNDFFKYGLLRAISDQFKAPIGVWWMLTKDDAGTHGNHLSYLSNANKFRAADKDLFDSLNNIKAGFKVTNSKIDVTTRNVELIEKSAILPNARYWPRTDDTMQPDERAMLSHEILEEPFNRAIDFGEMKKYFNGCPVIFADPDNGIEVKTASKERHIRWNEISKLYDNGQSLIIYQHIQQTDIKNKATEKSEQLRRLLGSEKVHFRAFGSVVFLIVPQTDHWDSINSALEDFDSRFGTWVKHSEA